MEDVEPIGVHETNEKCYKEEEICEVDQQQLINCGNNVVISIKEMLEQLPRVNKESSIYRVPKQLRDMNHKAYAPLYISIGPFHHNNNSEDLIAGRRYKLQSLVSFLRRINKEEPLEFLVKTAESWVFEARNCYAEHFDMKDEEFVKMMLVDACFIVEFMMGHKDGEWNFEEQKNATLSFYKGIIPDVYYDLIKLENQVPLFLIQRLCDLIIPKPSTNVDPISILKLVNNGAQILGFLGLYEFLRPNDLPRQPKHLVDVLSMYFLPPMHHQKNSEDNSGKKNNFLLRFFDSMRHLWQKHDHKNVSEKKLYPPSISELCEAGVTIKKAENPTCITDISFKNGVLKIPLIVIDDSFEPIMRNLLAFQHFSEKMEEMYVTHYVLFMDFLISTEKDVNLLMKAEVIINSIGGSDKEVSEMFNNLNKSIISSSSPHFENLNEDLWKHCNGWWNKSKASLKHNYFNTPWAFISFFAATFLIILTILQTILSAISTFP